MKTKNLKIILPVLGFIVLALIACQPEKYTLGELISKADLKYSVTQNPNDPNMIILTSLNPGMTPLWIHPMGRSTRVVDTVKIPFAGVYQFIYGAESPGGFVQADPFNLTLTTNNLMYVNDPLWTALTGGVGHEKTWLLDLDADGVSKFFGGPLYFYGTSMIWGGGCNGSDCWNWNPDWKGNEWLMSKADFGTMTFDLKGGAHVKVVHNTIPARGTENGTYFLDADAKTLTMTDAAPLHDSGRESAVSAWGTIKLLSLTENTMQLAVMRTNNEGPCFLVYNFISKEYSDNWTPPVVGDPNFDFGDQSELLAVSNTKTWKFDLQVPYNWTNLNGGFLNTWNSRADIIATGWAPYGDADVVNIDGCSISFSSNGTVVVTQDNGTSATGTYKVDEPTNMITFTGITPSLLIASWVTATTTAENQWKIVKVEKTGTEVTGIWFGKRDPAKSEYMVFHFLKQAKK